MMTGACSHPARIWLAGGRVSRIGWALFTLLALSLALPGLETAIAAAATPCAGTGCLPGQVTPAEMAVILETYSWLQYVSNALILYGCVAVFYLLAAALFVWCKPNNVAAVAGAFVLTAAATRTLAAATALTHPALRPAAQALFFVQLAGLLPFFCTLPDGRFRPDWLRGAAWAAMPVAALIAFEMVGSAAGYWFGAGALVLIIGAALYRYRALRATPAEESAIWALVGVALLLVGQWAAEPLALLSLPSLSPASMPSGFLPMYMIMGMLLPVAALACLAVALLGDELFRVEVVLNRALVYSLLTLLIVGVYGAVVGYLSLLFREQGSVWFSLLAAGLVAVLFQPLRERVQRFVNGLLYGERDDPYRVIAGLGERLERALEPAAVPAAVVETVHDSLRLPYAAIAIPGAGGEELLVAAGAPSGEPLAFPIAYQGGMVGRLLVCPRRGDAGLSAADRSLLADLAQQAGPAIHGLRLLADLQRLSADLQSSREQLVLSREEERRRLRRNLHDDLAPTLAGLSLRAGAIADLIDADPARAAALADSLDAAIRDAVGSVRRLVYDLRPAALDELGLLGAIRERALDYGSGPGLRVSVDTPETLPPLPAAVEVAAYRIVQEGLMNVARHAAATHCRIRLAAGDGQLAIEIVDDGVGLPVGRVGNLSEDAGKLPALQEGVGLPSIRERATELGGACAVSPGPDGGTRLWVSLPIARAEGE
jgi:signal transduction histidine kinase